MGFPSAETPAYDGTPGYTNNYRQRREPHIAVSCRVHNVVKRVRSFCLKNDIELIKVVDGPNVLKISVRSVLHTQKLEKALTNIVQVDGLKVEAVSLPESIDVTKRKRGFLLFMNLADFKKDQAQVRKRFAETGLDYKITVVDGLTHAGGKKAEDQPDVSTIKALMQKMQEMQLELNKLKDKSEASIEIADAPEEVAQVSLEIAA